MTATLARASNNGTEADMSTQQIGKGFGCLKGKISSGPDFDEPLEDFREYME